MASTDRIKPTKTSVGVSRASQVYGPADPAEEFITGLTRKLDVEVTQSTHETCEFEVKGITAPLANALRRILLSEVPSIAIETVYIHINTSIIQDEVLSHRLGLIPIRADFRDFEMPSEEAGATDMNTVVFTLDSIGESKPARANAEVGDDLTRVYTRDLLWVPQGDQETRFADAAIAPVEDDILIAKLLPGQEISLEAHAVRGIGADHAKFSPVATASYRLKPEVVIAADEATAESLRETPVEGFYDDEAATLVATCPMGVFDIEDVGRSITAAAAASTRGNRRAVVARPQACTMCRECLRPAGWEDRIRLRKVNDHFLFRVESTGALPAATLVKEALKILSAKALEAKQALDDAAAAATGAGAAESGLEGMGVVADVEGGGAVVAGTGARAADDADRSPPGGASSSSFSSSSSSSSGAPTAHLASSSSSSISESGTGEKRGKRRSSSKKRSSKRE